MTSTPRTEPQRPPRSKGRVTLADVAQAADTSAITVSRVLNQPDQVSPKLRERVQASVKATGYVPNRAARSLAGTRNYNIAVIIPSLSNAVFSDVVRGLYDVCQPAGYELMMGNSYYTVHQEQTLLTSLLQQRPDGLIIAGVNDDEDSQQRLREAGVPVVQIMETGHRPPVDISVGFSHRAAGEAMADYLLQQGYQAPGLIAAQLDGRTQRRMSGFLDRLDAAGIDTRRLVTSAHASSVRLGGELLNDLLAAHPDTDAIFCANDDLAWGAVFECQRRHLSVPSQLAISGFNDLEPSACINPALTTIATPLYEIGSTAARLLLQRLDDEGSAEREHDLGFRICRRDSA